MFIKINPIKIPGRQRGVATLLASLILLLGITLMTFSAAKVTILEQKISANDYRAKQAFEAAQAGLERGFANLAVPAIRTALIADADLNRKLDLPVPANPNRQGTLPNGGTYTINYTQVAQYQGPPGAPDLVQIISTGTSDDGSATETISQYARIASLIPNLPRHPLVAGGEIDMTSALFDINNLQDNRTIWAGGDVRQSLGGILTSIRTADGTTGVSKNDSNLAGLNGNQFFRNFFGATKAQIQAKSDVQYLQVGSLAGVQLSLLGSANLCGKTVFVDGDLLAASANVLTTIGCPNNPVTLIVNGNINISGVAALTRIYGTIYAAGNAIFAGALFEMQGSIIAEENLTLAAVAGSLSPLPPGVVASPQFVGRVSGSWTD